jgi:anti-sigma B factor antagonist
MNGASANLMVAIFDSLVCVKVCGRANFTTSVDLKKVVNELAQRGYTRFGIDLADCQTMDSTFLGVLAGIGLKFSPNSATAENPAVLIYNPSVRVLDLLENLGVAHLFKIVNDADTKKEHFEPVVEEQASRVEVTRTCLEAHKTLMELNPENVKKFKDVTQFLAEDLKKMGG